VNCEHAAALIPSAAVAALAEADREDLDQHLTVCAVCRVLAAESNDVIALMNLALEPSQPSVHLRRRLLAQVFAEATLGHQRPWWRRATKPHFATKHLAATVLAVGVAVLVVARIVIPARAVTPTEVAVTGTTADPSASGTLIESGSSADDVLTVDGLAPPPGTNTVYEVWLINSDGALKAAAFLSRIPDANAWTAVITGGTAGYRSIAATVEPAGGSPQPSGVEVVSGQL
jgi:anti-sigma-K factor RskA